MFKEAPNIWYKLPTTRKGLLMIPLTKEACERHGIEPEHVDFAITHKKKKKPPKITSIRPSPSRGSTASAETPTSSPFLENDEDYFSCNEEEDLPPCSTVLSTM